MLTIGSANFHRWQGTLNKSSRLRSHRDGNSGFVSQMQRSPLGIVTNEFADRVETAELKLAKAAGNAETCDNLALTVVL